MVDQEDLDVIELEPELLYACPDERHILLEIAVDQDVTLRRGDQIIGETLAADIVDIPGDFERRKRFRPVIRLGMQSAAGAAYRNNRAYKEDPPTKPVLTHML